MAEADLKPANHATQCDPISLEIISGALGALMKEVGSVIERTSMSPFIREKKDYDASLFDATGRLVANTGMNVSTGILNPIFEIYPIETMEPGDIYWYNDCYASKGAVSHSPDQVFARPIFFEGRIVAFVQTWAHFNDIGGMRAGTLSPDCTEIFQEGTIIPPVRLARGDVINEDLLRIFARNSRFPDMLRGDVRALLAGGRLGELRTLELFKRFGTDVLADAFDQLIHRTQAEVRARAKSKFPRGSHSFVEYLDDDGFGGGPFAISVKMDVSGNRITVDCTESSDQTKGPFNYLLDEGSMDRVLALMLLQADPRYPSNEGIRGLVDELKLRQGSLLQPNFPAALGLRGVTGARMFTAWKGIFAKITGGDGPASNSSFVLTYLRGLIDNKPFLISDPLGVGYGARPYADGLDGIYLTSQENYPSEFIESTYPVRMRNYALAKDSCGAGRWRGGCGVIREFEVLAPEAMLSIRMDSIDFPPWGLNGGKSGGKGQLVINPGRPDEKILPAISDGTMVKQGDIVRTTTGGGGGWGHPYDREPERVLGDVLDGFISPESALEDYGVVIDGAGEIDLAATGARRADRYPTKLFHRGEYINEL